MAELESALQNIAQKLGNASPDNEKERTAASTLQQLRSEILPPTPNSMTTVPSPDNHLDAAPVLSLFDNAILSRREDDGAAETPLSGAAEHLPDQLTASTPKVNKIRKALLAQFPPVQLEAAILTVSDFWWNSIQDMFPGILGMRLGSTVCDFVADAKASGNVQKIAKALLCIAVSLQEIPMASPGTEFEGMDSHRMGEHYVSIVDELVLRDDELVGTLDGIECLMLQAKHDSNNARIRRAWVVFRRAISFCQLLGLHIHPSKAKSSTPDAIRRHALWKAFYQGDRLVSLLLGLPFAVTEMRPEHLGDLQPTGEGYLVRLAGIVGHVIERNQEPCSSNTLPHTIKIEGEMMALAAQMPNNWWTLSANNEDVQLQIYHRHLPQFWHHQARTLLHLPFMLKAAADRRYEYNRIAALESARDMIRCYATFRPVTGYGSLVCKVLDFQAFTAAMVLVLNSLSPSGMIAAADIQEAEKDQELISITTQILHQASVETDGGVATQAAKALELFSRPRDQCPAGQTTAKIVIPYFGTVVFGPGASFEDRSSKASTTRSSPQTHQLPTPGSDIINEPQLMPAYDLFPNSQPYDFNLGNYPTQQQVQDGGMGGGPDMFSNINLDLDQDWSWFWNNTDWNNPGGMAQ